MLKQIFISILLIATFISCASSRRFSSRHGNNEDSADTRKQRYDNNSELNNYKNILESRVGVASYYSDKYDGKKTTSGEIYNPDKLTAAHLKYNMGTIVRVKNLKNRKTVIVKINDRMTDDNGRIIDLSRKAAEELDMVEDGIAKVQVDVLQWGE